MINMQQSQILLDGRLRLWLPVSGLDGLFFHTSGDVQIDGGGAAAGFEPRGGRRVSVEVQRLLFRSHATLFTGLFPAAEKAAGISCLRFVHRAESAWDWPLTPQARHHQRVATDLWPLLMQRPYSSALHPARGSDQAEFLQLVCYLLHVWPSLKAQWLWREEPV